MLAAVDHLQCILGHRRRAHLRHEVVGSDLGRRHQDAVFALEGLFLAAVEEEGDVRVLLGFGDTQLRQPFAKVFAEALDALSARERNVLRLYLIDGVSAEVIGKMYRVHRATVARWITRARQTVQRETRRRLHAAVKLDGTSFESVVGLMWDGLDLSLATFLRED